jgi:hypothetical protein
MTDTSLWILGRRPRAVIAARSHPALSATQAIVLAKWNAKFALNLILPGRPLLTGLDLNGGFGVPSSK